MDTTFGEHVREKENMLIWNTTDIKYLTDDVYIFSSSHNSDSHVQSRVALEQQTIQIEYICTMLCQIVKQFPAQGNLRVQV